MTPGKKNQIGKKNIYLIGFMGAGKSTVGQILAKKLNKDFYDTDELIEEATGKSIAEIFATDGENYFRDREEEAVGKIARLKDAVVALGGGAILRDKNLDQIRNSGVSIYLKWRPHILLQRIIHDDSRPLVSNKPPSLRLSQLMKLFGTRKPLYEQANFSMNCSEQMTESQIADQIISLLKTQQ